MRRTLDSVVAQTVPPALWVIVDDGSTDATPGILDEYASRFDFIRVVRRSDRGRRSVGPGVVDAFYEGYRYPGAHEFEFFAKLDLDLELPARYFEILLARMHREPRLGTCSGKPYFVHRATGALVSERCGDEMSVGMTKFYRRSCFEQIGGFVREVMWDGIDCHRCRMHGWLACSWDEPDLRFLHLRPMGASDQGILHGRMRHGYGQYFMGTSLSYMAISALYRMLHPPRIVGGLAMAWGFVKAMATGRPRFDDEAFRQFLRAYQWRCLLTGKKRATRFVDQRSASQWRPAQPIASADTAVLT